MSGGHMELTVVWPSDGAVRVVAWLAVIAHRAKASTITRIGADVPSGTVQPVEGPQCRARPRPRHIDMARHGNAIVPNSVVPCHAVPMQMSAKARLSLCWRVLPVWPTITLPLSSIVPLFMNLVYASIKFRKRTSVIVSYM